MSINVSNAIRLYLRIYQNNYLHLKRIKFNKNQQDWHYEGNGRFYLQHPALESYTVRKRLIFPFINSLIFIDDEQENAFWDIFNAMNRMFYIAGGASDGQDTTVDNRARLFVALAKNNTHYTDEFRLRLIKKLLCNCFIDFFSVSYLDITHKSLYFTVNAEQKIVIKDFVQNWQISNNLTPQDKISLAILQDYYVSLLDFLENGLTDAFLNNYQLPNHISPLGKRIKIAPRTLADIYPYSI